MITNLGLRIKELRTQKGLSQKQLATILDLKTSTIVSAYEMGDRAPSLKTLIRMANFFNVSTDYLLGVAPQTPVNLEGLTPSDAELVIALINSLKSRR